MTMARNWREVRADAIAQGRVDVARADAARRVMHDTVQAHRLAEIRKAQGHARQADEAARRRVDADGHGWPSDSLRNLTTILRPTMLAKSFMPLGIMRRSFIR